MGKIQLSLRVDPDLVRKAQRVLGARSKTAVVERSLAAVVELEQHRRLIRRFSGTGKPDDFRRS
jgi:predicted transcriptional regulator